MTLNFCTARACKENKRVGYGQSPSRPVYWVVHVTFRYLQCVDEKVQYRAIARVYVMAQEQICRLCTHEVSNGIDLFSADSVERGVADRIATVLELSLDKGDGLTGYVCEICHARFAQLERRLEVERLHAKKSYEKLATKAGILVDESKLMLVKRA